MRAIAKTLTILMWFVLLPTTVSAQAVIAGVVKDSSGGILPGVTVEAASPALIEKVRTAVTDGTGQYPHREPAARHVHRHVHAPGLAASSVKASS